MASNSYFKTYRTNVKIGNWKEEQHLEEDVRMEFLSKRERGELAAQKVDFLKHHILRPVKLSVTMDGGLHIGDVVMLVNIGEQGECCALSINAYVENMVKIPSPGIIAPCGISAGRSIQPCVRTAFIITSVDGTPEGSTLHYEQSFALKTTSGFARGLYLTSDVLSFRKSAQRSRLQEVNVDESNSFLSWWKIVHFDPQERLEHEGLPVPANFNVVILHCKTNRALAVLEHHVLGTTYGNEYEVTAHTFLDAHKAEKSNNHWILCTSDPGGEGLVLLNRLQSEADRMASTQENTDSPTEYITCSVCNYREDR
ncbi:cilia- and flagella-associated protein 161 isoform X2 [Dunckerocampus dactyliophorus]|uniref:cilia- and flagella-associated protein 161 isoform X2 n=1 Tax=Dunckerocampus dactyliophorus TaxID=161453 RepID=UPI002405AF5C|nr:cilia- and flagella-associated protein 161 isoform X2 [Dunckerocampus dactyliophorus]